jgi:TolA-binding protein
MKRRKDARRNFKVHTELRMLETEEKMDKLNCRIDELVHTLRRQEEKSENLDREIETLRGLLMEREAKPDQLQETEKTKTINNLNQQLRRAELKIREMEAGFHRCIDEFSKKLQV